MRATQPTRRTRGATPANPGDVTDERRDQPPRNIAQVALQRVEDMECQEARERLADAGELVRDPVQPVRDLIHDREAPAGRPVAEVEPVVRDEHDDDRRAPEARAPIAGSRARERLERSSGAPSAADVRSSHIAMKTIRTPATTPIADLLGLQRLQDRVAETAGADEGGDHDDRERHHDHLVQAEHDRLGGERQLDVAQHLQAGRAEGLSRPRSRRAAPFECRPR